MKKENTETYDIFVYDIMLKIMVINFLATVCIILIISTVGFFIAGSQLTINIPSHPYNAFFSLVQRNIYNTNSMS